MNSPPLARSWCAEKPCQCNSTASTFLPERGSPINSLRLLPRPNQEAHLAGENSKEAAWGRKRSSHVCIGSRLCKNPVDAMIPLLNRGGLMKGFVQGVDRQQTTLLPECLDDWVGESNPIRAVDVFVDALELRDL